MAQHFDAIVIGMGPGGEVAASKLLAAGRRVAVIERELIGGECAYWACIPSKTLLRPPEAQGGANRAAGVDGARLDWPAARDYRDYMIRHMDDHKQITGYEDAGATVVKGAARIIGPGRVEADGHVMTAQHVIIATGSDAAVPPIQGLADVPVWTNRQATTLTDIPSRVVMIGGSAVGVEVGLFLRRFGAEVTILQRSGRLLSREDPRPGELTEQYLSAEGIDVRANTSAARVHSDGKDTVVVTDGGDQLRCDVIVVGTGRTPRTGDLGLEATGAQLGRRGELIVDEQCRAGEGLWGLGDVTAVMPFTHVAKYQANVVADNILGSSRAARYEGIPRVVFTDPEVAAVGATTQEAKDQGCTVTEAEVSLAEAIARPWTYEQHPRGHLGVLADRNRGLLVGAWAVGPQASEWIHTPALAIREQIPIDRVLDQVPQFPTYNEGWLQAVQRLDV